MDREVCIGGGQDRWLVLYRSPTHTRITLGNVVLNLENRFLETPTQPKQTVEKPAKTIKRIMDEELARLNTRVRNLTNENIALRDQIAGRATLPIGMR